MHTVTGMRWHTATSTFGRRGRRAFSFFEVIVTVILAGVLALVAVSIYNWAFADSSDRLVKLDAYTFERNVRALANIELRAVDNTDAATVIEEMTTDQELTIVPSGTGFNITRGNTTYCVVLGDEINEKGSVTDGACS